MRVVRSPASWFRPLHTWDKQVAGTGHWLRNQTEHLILATRGDFPAPLEGTQWTSFLSERKGRHSAKPLRYYELIEAYTAGLTRIEGFSRLKEPRPGWVFWGNQAPASSREDSSGGGRQTDPVVAPDVPALPCRRTQDGPADAERVESP